MTTKTIYTIPTPLKAATLSLATAFLLTACGGGSGSAPAEEKAEQPLLTQKEYRAHLLGEERVERGEEITYTLFIENLPIEEGQQVVLQLIDQNFLSILPNTDTLKESDYSSIREQMELIEGASFHEANRTFAINEHKSPDANITFAIDTGIRGSIELSITSLSESLTVATGSGDETYGIKPHENNSTVSTNIYSPYTPAPQPEPEGERVEMVIGESVEVHEGDSIVKNSEDTVIEIEHTLEDDKKVVTLISGSATLIKGDYELQE